MSRPTFAIPIVAGIGNALMAVPLVRQLKRNFPHAHVLVSARIKPMAECFERLPEVDEVRLMGKGAAGMFQSMREIARLRPEAFIIPFPSNRWQYMALALASGARRRILHAYPTGYFGAAHFLPAERLTAVRGMHDVLQNLYLLRKLDVEPDVHEAPTFPLTDDDRARADEALSAAGLPPGTPFVAVHAGSATTILAQAKRWPTANYAQLAQRLGGAHDLPVVILEGPDEQGVADEILEHHGRLLSSSLPPGGGQGEGVLEPRNGSPAPSPPRILRLRGPLATAGAVLSRAKLYVGTDSGLAHLAAAVGTPPVTLFAPADPDRVCPYGYRHLVVQPRCSCCPCFLYPFESSRPKLRRKQTHCIQKITVDQVLAMVAKTLTAAPETRPETQPIPA